MRFIIPRRHVKWNAGIQSDMKRTPNYGVSRIAVFPRNDIDFLAEAGPIRDRFRVTAKSRGQ